MIEKLKELLNNSYCPYSKFNVSAIVVTKDLKNYPGVNVENISYSGGICAERNAIHAAITSGYKKGDFKEIHIISKENNNIVKPCFICRQTMLEFFDNDTEIFLYNYNGDKEKYLLNDLCPEPFVTEKLGN